jgi:hypothetical protein
MLLLFIHAAWAANFSDVKLSFSGMSWLELGRIEASSDTMINKYSGSPLFHSLGFLEAHVDINESWRGDIGFGTMLFYPARSTPADAYQVNKLVFTFLTKFKLAYTWGDWEKPFLQANAGVFPVRTNPHATNLGEYLLKGPVYPGYLFSGFEEIHNNQICGLNLRSHIQELKLNLYYVSEIAMKPLFDFSLAGTAAYNFFDVFELGVGANLYHLVPVEEELTKKPGTVSAQFNDGPDNENNSYSYIEVRRDANGDTITDSLGFHEYDTTFLTHQGTKLMARFAFDIKELIPETRFFKPADLRLYGEAGIIGIANQAYFYEHISERIPVMLGFNIPSYPLISFGFLTLIEALDIANVKIMDGKIDPPSSLGALIAWPVLGLGTWALERFLGIDASPDLVSLEVEWYNSPHRGDYEWLNERAAPAPKSLNNFTTSSGQTTFSPHGDDYKWSIYMRKMVKNRFWISGGIANDHFRTQGSGYFPTYDEACSSPQDWYWKARFGYFF